MINNAAQAQKLGALPWYLVLLLTVRLAAIETKGKICRFC
jgi:hypothetical protein